jgi:DNA-binding PadR family transcriptional regulator
VGNLTNTEKQILREMNGEELGLYWGGEMSVCLTYLRSQGFLSVHKTDHEIRYVLTQKGKDKAEELKKEEKSNDNLI